MKCPIKNNSDYDMEAHTDLVDSLYNHADGVLGFKRPPSLIFQSDPRNYGALAKTAEYNPASQEITIYVDGRHIKDILRSFAHELVHHHQNEQGRLSGATVTQGEQDFDDIEGEAYYTGNLKLFRKWEDMLKEENPSIYNERRIYKMSTKDWKNRELSKLMTERFGFKMDLRKLNENVQEDQLEEAMHEEEKVEEAMHEEEKGEEAMHEEEAALDEGGMRMSGAEYVMQAAGRMAGKHALDTMSLTQLWRTGMYNFLQDLADELGPMIDRGALEEAKKPDEDGDGVPDWADKKPGEDDHDDEKKED